MSASEPQNAEGVCTNCDGRKCMACVLRQIHEECRDDCPFCRPDRDHYDLTARRRARAIELGAIPEPIEAGTARRKAVRDAICGAPSPGLPPAALTAR
jgi:hypothetical protein